jgi:hypothetical protein
MIRQRFHFGIKSLFVATTCISLWASLLGGLGTYWFSPDSPWPAMLKRTWFAIFVDSLMVLPIVAACALFGRTRQAILLWLGVFAGLLILIRWS